MAVGAGAAAGGEGEAGAEGGEFCNKLDECILQKMNFVLKMMNFVLKKMDFCITNDEEAGAEGAMDQVIHTSILRVLCIKNNGLFIKHDESCIQMMNLLFKMMDFVLQMVQAVITHIDGRRFLNMEQVRFSIDFVNGLGRFCDGSATVLGRFCDCFATVL